MDPYTGNLVHLDPAFAAEAQRTAAALQLGIKRDEVVLLEGSEEHVKRISSAVAMAAAERQRRRKRTKAQRASRKRNR